MSHPRIKAVITDMDGTLLSPGCGISPRTVETVQRLQSAVRSDNNKNNNSDSGAQKQPGRIFFIVATARPHLDAVGILHQHGIRPDYLITSNGARVHDGAQRVLLARNFTPAAAHRIVQEALAVAEAAATGQSGGDAPAMDESNTFSLAFLRGRPFSISLYRESEWLVDLPCPEAVAAAHPSCVCESIGVDGMAALTPETLSDVHEIFFQGTESKLQPLYQHFTEPTTETEEGVEESKWKAHFTFSAPFVLDCVPHGVDKGKALEEVAALLGISPSEVAAFGDGMNDESMLRIVGFPFVMQNANPALKAALPHAPVIGSNAEDGVARQLETLFLFPANTSSDAAPTL